MNNKLKIGDFVLFRSRGEEMVGIIEEFFPGKKEKAHITERYLSTKPRHYIRDTHRLRKVDL